MIIRKILVLSALSALAGNHADAFTPSSLVGPRFGGSALFAVDGDVSIPYDAAARLEYDAWRETYGKGDFDAAKYEAFKTNYEMIAVANVVAKKEARESGITAKKYNLNEYADMTEEEYLAMSTGSAPAPAPAPEPVSSDVTIVYDSAARLAYDEWRAKFSKGDFDDAKYETFKANYETVTVFNVVAAKNAREGKPAVDKMELGESADSEKIVVDSGSSVDVMNEALKAAVSQTEASAALDEASAALAEEEQVRFFIRELLT